MSDDLVTEARRLATDKVKLIEDLKAAQDCTAALENARKQLQRIGVSDELQEQQRRTLREVDTLITAAKQYAGDRRKDARASWSQADLQRLGLARTPRRSAARTESSSEESSVPAPASAPSMEHGDDDVNELGE